ncbi:hypothetical protein KY285_037304 [Solanum tuberosum]|nr:hypothetical protein KY285_037304 [Solanum tuberosum]
MAQINDIDDVLYHLRRIKSQGDQSSIKIDQIEKLEMELRMFRTFIKYYHILLHDFFVKPTKIAKLIVKMLHRVFDGIPYECKTNLDQERLVAQLLNFIDEGNSSLRYNYEFMNDSYLSDYMDCLGKNLNDVLIMCLKLDRSDPSWTNEKILHYNRFIKQLKIVQKKMRFLRYLYATEINGYIDHEKLECLETRIQFMANNVGQFCHAFSINVSEFEDDTDEDEDEDDKDEQEYMNKPPYLLCLIELVENSHCTSSVYEPPASLETFKNKKLPKGFSHHLRSLLVYLKNKKLPIFPTNVSTQNIDVAIDFLFVFLDDDGSNHAINSKMMNEVFEKVVTIVGDVLYVIQKLLPRSVNIDDMTSKTNICSIQILEKIKDLKAPMETYYKSLKFSTPSQFPTIGGLSFLASLLRKLNEMSKSKSGLDFLMKPLFGNLEKELSALTSILEKELSFLSSIFRDIAKVHHEHEILKALHRHTINLAYEAEVSIDSILAQYNVFWHIFCSLPAILKEIKQISSQVTKMWSADVALKPCYVVAPSKHLPTQHSNPETDEEIVGFGKDTEKMLQYLIRAWCIISQTYSRRELLKEIFSQVTGSKDKEDEVGELADRLRKSLMGKRYLIVLDDMWDCMAWDDLRLSFPDVGMRSRIVVTTRLEEVGKQVKYHTDPYSLPFLTTEESCQLLQKKVFQKEDCPPELQYVSQAVAEKCKGLPLVIVLVAGIIKKRKMEESWWNEVKDALFDYLDHESEEYSRVTMQLSFDNLPDCLKPCLLYIGMFPEDARIPVSKLISLWIAEGFVQNIESGRLMEEAAEGFLMDLIHSNVVMVSKREYNGKVKYCHVHDVVLHFCLEKSREEKFMLVMKGNCSKFQPFDWKESRMRFILTEKLSKFASLESKTRKSFHQHLRSLIMTNGLLYFNWIVFPQVREMRLLKVLDLTSFDVKYLSSATLKPLIHLKYLGVSACEFYFHPEPHLSHLETLIVKDLLFRYTELPDIFWKMEQLRHVDINKAEFYLEEGMIEESCKLNNLRILRRVRIYNAASEDVLIQSCPNLQQLYITFEESVPGEPFCFTLESLIQLQILSLSCDCCLSGLQLPSNLKKLVLRGSNIESAIPVIAGLPSLEYLQLWNSDYFQSEEWSLGDITFHKLKLLKMVFLRISRWDASDESFPLLETLVMKKCTELEEIPLSFADIPSLKQIKLIGSCKESLVASAMKIKEEVEAIEGCDRLNLFKEQSDWGEF